MSGPISYETDSGVPVAEVYTSHDVREGLDDRLGAPGAPPYTRGPYPRMYREQLWSMRQYAGYGAAEDTNARYRYLLEQGQTALSVAFDLPTQLGFDSDHPMATAEVGRVGVAIDTADDMAVLFDALPLDKLSVNFTINATAPIILAFYLVAAERQNVPFSALTGTLQNDILKEFLARKTFIFPPAHSLRLTADVVDFATQNLPRFNPISITGYHAREAGCDAVQEVGLTMASAIAYATEFTSRGLAFDDFAPRLSFHFSSTLDLFEEAAKVRAARRLWHRVAVERFGAQKPNSSRLRFFSGCSGATLTAQEPLNNVVRSTLQCLGAVLGGAQSIHVMGYDEALEIPTEDSVRLALRTQQIIALESGVTRTVDPLAGSYFVESLTDEIEQRAWSIVEMIDASGGAVRSIELGIPQRWIADTAYRLERAINDATRPKVGVNVYVDEGAASLEPQLFEMDEHAALRQISRTVSHRKQRRTREANAALNDLSRTLGSEKGVMPALLNCARSGVTLGEAADAMRQVFGEYREPSPW